MAISLKSQRYAGRDLSCISGDFVIGLTLCARSNGFSLSAPNGSAPIVGIVDRRQDYARHEGGVVGYSKSHTTVALTGGFNSPGSDLKDDWSFTIDRQTGKGTLIRVGRPAAAFACSGAI